MSQCGVVKGQNAECFLRNPFPFPEGVWAGDRVLVNNKDVGFRLYSATLALLSIITVDSFHKRKPEYSVNARRSYVRRLWMLCVVLIFSFYLMDVIPGLFWWLKKVIPPPRYCGVFLSFQPQALRFKMTLDETNNTPTAFPVTSFKRRVVTIFREVFLLKGWRLPTIEYMYHRLAYKPWFIICFALFSFD